MNCTAQFADLYILDTVMEPPVWTNVENPESKLEKARWNHAACSVMAIPSWKLFVFGGTSGDLSGSNLRGDYLNDIVVLDTGNNKWSYPEISGEAPTPRADTVIEYDAKGSKLVVFGGWANEWFADICTLDVAHVVGPPYAIMDIYPNLGAITGGTHVEIGGIDFVNTADVIVRFASKKGSVDVKGTFVSQTELRASPDFSSYPAGEVEVRIALNGDSFTTTSQRFSFFAVTDAYKCLVFGPGVLSGCACNEETLFVIQARDSHNHDRTTGGDEFKVAIKLIGGGDEGDDLYIRSGVTVRTWRTVVHGDVHGAAAGRLRRRGRVRGHVRRPGGHHPRLARDDQAGGIRAALEQPDAGQGDDERDQGRPAVGVELTKRCEEGVKMRSRRLVERRAAPERVVA